ncbi:iron deficiency-induced protein A [Iodidimonas gelatinilytica]|uniref:Iron deficiency-induced protein A n=1 Tax=Iodidimonas gelatinilytica TaxID=1236966 RepID=A0A5A7MN04_9PROT|nr:Fe(3+) ABC transporter substrate-binding protein [Iodidimonas gelatinilytica]GEQ97361.1 iron deficiency-induced protein A [Iodidimonas gelatinilytica]
MSPFSPFKIGSAALLALGTLLPLSFAQSVKAQEVNIYSSRHYQTDERLYSDFEKATGIHVNRLEGGGDALIERISQEGRNSPADILLTVDAGMLWRAEDAGLFQSTRSDVLEDRIPAHLRHPKGDWFGFSSRARLIFVNKDLADPASISRYEDLADPEWRGQICIRSSSNVYNLSLMASLIAHLGEEKAQDWATGVVENFARKPQGGDTDQLRAAATGECAIAVANSYYFVRLMQSDDPADQEVVSKLAVIFPNQDDRGTHVNISGAGIVKNAPNKAEARAFLEYLSSDSAQRYFAAGNNEYPVVDIKADNASLQALGTFKADDINVSVLGKNQPKAQQLFDRAGWR